MKIKLLLFVVLTLSLSAIAQPGDKLVRVVVRPNGEGFDRILSSLIRPVEIYPKAYKRMVSFVP